MAGEWGLKGRGRLETGPAATRVFTGEAPEGAAKDFHIWRGCCHHGEPGRA